MLESASDDGEDTRAVDLVTMFDYVLHDVVAVLIPNQAGHAVVKLLEDDSLVTEVTVL